MVDAIVPIVVLSLVVYVWMIQPAMHLFRRRRSGRHLPDPWVT